MYSRGGLRSRSERPGADAREGDGSDRSSCVTTPIMGGSWGRDRRILSMIGSKGFLIHTPDRIFWYRIAPGGVGKTRTRLASSHEDRPRSGRQHWNAI